MTNTQEFQEWFKESILVDNNGKPLAMYHGTRKEFAQFDLNERSSNTGSGNTNLGFYFLSDSQLAAEFVEMTSSIDEGDALVVKAYLSMSNPIYLKTPEFFTKKEQASTLYEIMSGEKLAPEEALEAINDGIGLGEYEEAILEVLCTEEARVIMTRDGFDGVISNYGNNIPEYCVFSPAQIKIINKKKVAA